MDSSKHNLKSVIRKIFAAFILVSVAIAAALSIARFSFSELMTTVDDMSQPNQKILLLNRLFEEIITVDQIQRAKAIESPNEITADFLDGSVAINLLIDSLKRLPWEPDRLEKLNEMKLILAKRNELFLSYLKVKAKLLDNKSFFIQLDTLGTILQEERLTLDTGAMKSKRRTTTTIVPDTLTKQEEQKSFLKRLFGKKQKRDANDSAKIQIQEEFSVMIDSQAIARQAKAIHEIESIMREMELDQRLQRKKLQTQELDLIQANSLFISQLLGILHNVENEEVEGMRAKNSHAVSVMNATLSRINFLMLGFFSAAAILVYFMWIDVSRSNYYKQQLEKARDEAQELTHVKQRFLANMSHEIRTPLQSIIGYAEQLRKKHQRDEDVDAIYTSSEHLLHIVNEVLDYSRISSGKLTLSNEPFRLLSIIKEVESAMRIQADQKNVSFILDCEKSTDFILMGDGFRLRQILYNLLGNAIKFTDKGFIKLAVRTAPVEGKIKCHFEVIDTGIGIEKTDLEKIFNQFEQANTSIAKQFGGTGLGLTIVKTLVDSMNGAIDVSSEPGLGTSFQISILFDKAISPGKGNLIANRLLKETIPVNKALIVDDDPLILRLCSVILKKHDVNFLTFPKAKLLLKHGADKSVSHIFIDIRMPEMNGIELCHVLRKTFPKETLIIALTAHVLPEERETLLQEGFDAVLPKPFHEQQLLSLLGIEAEESFHHDEMPDLSKLRQLTLGDESLFQSIITQFTDETLDDLVKWKELAQSGDGKEMREVVHKMVGRFAQVGVSGLSHKLHHLEKELAAGGDSNLLQLEIAALIEEVNRMVIKIRLSSYEEQG